MYLQKKLSILIWIKIFVIFVRLWESVKCISTFDWCSIQRYLFINNGSYLKCLQYLQYIYKTGWWLGMQRYNFFRSDTNILRIGRYAAQFFILNECRISILLCVDLIVTLLCVKHNLLQCFSTGRSKVGRGLFTAKETTSTKNVILNVFLMRDFYFKRRAWKLLTLSDHLTQMQVK